MEYFEDDEAYEFATKDDLPTDCVYKSFLG